MSSFCGAHRAPRASVDPIDSARVPPSPSSTSRCDAHWPPRPIALVLDADRRGRTIVVVDGTAEPDSILDVVERMAESIAASGRAGALVMATARPGGGPEPGDEDRWLEASDIADDLGVELVEWFVIGGDVPTVAANAWCPRDLLGEAPRWRSW